MSQGLTITWLGHGTFLFDTPGGKRVLLDPWFEGNPTFPPPWREQLTSGVDLILVTHGHFDHVHDVITTAQVTGATVAGIFELAAWLGTKGIAEGQTVGFNKGGTATLAGINVTMTDARHSSGLMEHGNLVYLGEPCGYVLEFENGFKVYHTGDTAVTSDMQLIGELYQPDMTILPIGGFYTMDPRQAAYALRLIGSRLAIPEHFGTFPILSGTPTELEHHLARINVQCDVIALEPGQSWTQAE